MGRHGAQPPPRRLPWGLVGWCAFSGTVAATALLLMGESWTAAALVLCAGAVGVGIVVALALLAAPSGASSGRRRDAP